MNFWLMIVILAAAGMFVWRRNRPKAPPTVVPFSEAQRHWKCPPELARTSTPRRVTIKPATKAWFVFWMLFLAGSGAAWTSIKVLPWLEQQRLLESEGVATHAAIIGQRVTHDSEGGADTFFLTYEYEVRGLSYRSETNVPVGYSRRAVGSTLPLHYAASRPEISRLDGFAGDGPWGFVAFVGFVWGFVVLWGVGLLRQKQWLVWGQAACGIVTKIKSDPESSQLTIHYEFRDSAGAVVTGWSSFDTDNVPAPQIGDTVTVVHESVKAKRHVLYPANQFQID